MKKVTWRSFLIGVIGVFMCLSLANSYAVIILDSTFKQSGFKQAEALALSPSFSSLIFIESDELSGSGSWIGNDEGHGYVLTAAHLFPHSAQISHYTFQTQNGRQYHGEALFLHPLWNENLDDRTGYDFALVRLKESITDAGAQPALYAGNEEIGKTVTFIGYGWRGSGKKGEDTTIDTDNKPAAAQGLVELVKEAIEPLPVQGDAGNYFAIWLPKEDGSLPNPFSEQGITRPISPLAGILGSGDSGGPAWIRTPEGWVIAGINSDGSGNAAYGDVSWFPRVSQVQVWIKGIIPNVRFLK